MTKVLLLIVCVTLGACATSTAPSTDWPANPDPFIRAQGWGTILESPGSFDAALFVSRTETTPSNISTADVRAAFNDGPSPVEVTAVQVENTRLNWSGTTTNIDPRTYAAQTPFGDASSVRLKVTGYNHEDIDLPAPVSPPFDLVDIPDSITLSSDWVIRYRNAVPGSKLRVTPSITAKDYFGGYDFTQPDTGTIAIPKDSLIAHAHTNSVMVSLWRSHLDSVTTAHGQRIAVLSVEHVNINRPVQQ